MKPDPRDLGFNYGSPSQAGERAPVYYEAMKIAEQLGKEASRASDLAWQLQMAIRDVRLACTPQELEQATARLEDKLTPYHNWRS